MRTGLASSGAALALVLTGLSIACGGGRREAQSPQPEAGESAACSAFDPLVDLNAAMRTPAAFGASTDLYYLVQPDEVLGYLRLAQKRLSAEPTSATRPLDGQLERFATALEARRDRLAEALGAVEKTYEAAESALEGAAKCKSVDMREASRPQPGAAAAAEKVRKANQAALASKACESALRLWSAARNVDLTSEVSSSSIAAQVSELRLDAERSRVRDSLAAALKEHAKTLRGFHTLATPKAEEQGPDSQALSKLEEEVEASLKTVSHTCFDQMPASDRVVGGQAEPRLVTVIVKPKWSGPLAQLPHDEGFGSGFVVRWRNAKGQVETRIVTNNHVMDGAFEAEIVSGDPEKSHGQDDAKDKTSATLIRASRHDDVAVLRVDPKSESSFAQGLAFRLSPAREQEQVVAAGFPGVGVRPSFQVSKGTVSNAKFGAEDPDASAMSAYVPHTAPIDPGNSGGPLLDADGHLLGMNTMKIVGRENVGLAIPTSRIQLALMRAEETPTFDPKHVEASCNAVVGALASPRPVVDSMSRFGLALYEGTQPRQGSIEAVAYRDRVQGQPGNPVDAARLRAYGGVRAAVEEEHGVRPFEVCFDVKTGDTTGSFRAKFRTRSKTHELTFAEEHGVLRVVGFE
jgi:S1-C subfamily serine protease